MHGSLVQAAFENGSWLVPLRGFGRQQTQRSGGGPNQQRGSIKGMSRLISVRAHATIVSSSMLFTRYWHSGRRDPASRAEDSHEPEPSRDRGADDDDAGDDDATRARKGYLQRDRTNSSDQTAERERDWAREKDRGSRATNWRDQRDARGNWTRQTSAGDRSGSAGGNNRYRSERDRDRDTFGDDTLSPRSPSGIPRRSSSLGEEPGDWQPPTDDGAGGASKGQPDTSAQQSVDDHDHDSHATAMAALTIPLPSVRPQASAGAQQGQSRILSLLGAQASEASGSTDPSPALAPTAAEHSKFDMAALNAALPQSAASAHGGLMDSQQQQQQHLQGHVNRASGPPPGMFAAAPPPAAYAGPWLYRDPQGEIQGPFPAAEMRAWFRDGFFKPDLIVATKMEGPFVPLGALFARGFPAFMAPQEIPPMSDRERHAAASWDMSNFFPSAVPQQPQQAQPQAPWASGANWNKPRPMQPGMGGSDAPYTHFPDQAGPGSAPYAQHGGNLPLGGPAFPPGPMGAPVHMAPAWGRPMMPQQQQQPQNAPGATPQLLATMFSQAQMQQQQQQQQLSLIHI